MATTSKKETTDLLDSKKIFFSIESIQKFLILNRSTKYDRRKMETTVFKENKKEHKHHIISSYRTGFMVCDQCGQVFGKIVGSESNLGPDRVCIKGLLAKYKSNRAIKENLQKLYNLVSDFEIPTRIFNRSLHIFQDTINKIKFKNGSRHLYALSSIYYSLKESNCIVLAQDLLEWYYRDIDIDKEEYKNVYKKFFHIYHDLTKRLELKKMNLCPEDYLFYLSKGFKLNHKDMQSANLMVANAKNSLPVGKSMNKGIAGGVFYICAKIDNLKISQKQIADTLKISTSTVSEYTKKINGVLPKAHFNNSEKKNHKK